MNRHIGFILLLTVIFFCGCNCDIVCTSYLKAIDNKCVYLEPIESQNPHVGKVLRDVIEKEFVRRDVQLCDANSATIFVGGSTFLTHGESAGNDFFSSKKSYAKQAIESVSITAKDADGNIVLSASYDNVEQYSASRLAKEFGAEIARRLK